MTSSGEEIALPAGETAQLAACEGLLALSPTSLNTDEPERVEYLTIMLALFYRGKTTLQAIITLCRHGFGLQAMMLCRSLFEDMVDAHWVRANPSEALARYSEHARLTNLKNAKRLENYQEVLREPLSEELQEAVQAIDKATEEQLRVRYGRHGTGSWTGLNLHRRVEAVAPQWGGEQDQSWLRMFRDFGNQYANETLHPTSSSLFRQVTPPSPETGGRIGLHSGSSTEGISQALLMASWAFAQLLGLLDEEFELGMRTAVEEAMVEALRTGHTLTDGQRRTTGRNEPCPCGSGRKFKHCHLPLEPE